MYDRLNKAEFTEAEADGENKEAMKALVWEVKPTGIIGFY